MKKIHKVKNLRPTRDFSFTKYFSPDKSPHTQFHYDAAGRIIYDYIPKNAVRKGTEHVAFSRGKTSYVRQKHGDLK